jgi:5'-methylthioinosine phosphorylase
MSARVAVIGGTGMNDWPGLKLVRQQRLRTPYGAPSAAIAHGRLEGCDVMFMPRHGVGHKFPPHRINYRANLWALREAGATAVIAIPGPQCNLQSPPGQSRLHVASLPHFSSHLPPSHR